MKTPVLTWEQQQVQAPPVMRMPVEEPVTVHHFAGVAVVKMEALMERRAVIGQLRNLASKIWPIVDQHLIRSLLLHERFDLSAPNAVKHGFHLMGFCHGNYTAGLDTN